MTKQEIIELIERYEIDLIYCKDAGYNEAAADIETKINELKSLLMITNN